MIDWMIIGAIVTVGKLLADFWGQLVDWIKQTAQRLSAVVRQALKGIAAFIERNGGFLKRIAKYYSKVDNQWIETISSRKIEFADLPQDLQHKLATRDIIDISNELELQLK